ncbi:10176_t:CDS:1, partial [Funneliformis caledonium]
YTRKPTVIIHVLLITPILLLRDSASPVIVGSRPPPNDSTME